MRENGNQFFSFKLVKRADTTADKISKGIDFFAHCNANKLITEGLFDARNESLLLQAGKCINAHWKTGYPAIPEMTRSSLYDTSSNGSQGIEMFARFKHMGNWEAVHSDKRGTCVQRRQRVGSTSSTLIRCVDNAGRRQDVV